MKVLEALNSEILPVLRVLKQAILGPLQFTEYFPTVLSSTNHMLPLVSYKLHVQTVEKRIEHLK